METAAPLRNCETPCKFMLDNLRARAVNFTWLRLRSGFLGFVVNFGLVVIFGFAVVLQQRGRQ